MMDQQQAYTNKTTLLCPVLPCLPPPGCHRLFCPVHFISSGCPVQNAMGGKAEVGKTASTAHCINLSVPEKFEHKIAVDYIILAHMFARRYSFTEPLRTCLESFIAEKSLTRQNRPLTDASAVGSTANQELTVL